MIKRIAKRVAIVALILVAIFAAVTSELYYMMPPSARAQTNTFCAANLACTLTGVWTFSTAPVFSTLLTASNGLSVPGGAFTTANQNGDIWMDGVRYTTVAAAIAALPSGGTLRIAAGTFPVTATLNMVSNLDIECSPNNATILQASASLNAPMIQASGINHFRLAGCVIDGNRSNNSNTNSLIQLTNSSHIDISNNHLLNSQGTGIFLVSGNDQIQITKNEIEKFGQALPTSSGSGICSIPNAAATNTNVSVIENRIHDNNIGMCIFASSTAANITRGWDVSHNKFYLNANDGFQLCCTGGGNGTNGPIQGGKATGNESFCNGWPANGTNRSTNCPAAGFLQSGSGASPSGSGFDFNSPVMEGWTVSNNQAHDNYFEGFDFTPQLIGTVNCTNVANSVCTIATGDNFNIAWKNGQGIIISGVLRVISVVTDATHLTLTSNTGALTGAAFVGTGYARMTVNNNVADHNGFGQPASSSGQGFSNIGYGDSFSGNVTKNNWSYGMIDQISTLVTHNVDKAFNNCRAAAGCSQGFLAQAGLREQFVDIATDDSLATNLQGTSVFLDANTTFSYVRSNALCNNTSCGLSTGIDNNAGGFNIWDSGRDRGVGGITSQLYFNFGGGTAAIDYVGGGGAFTSKLPAANGVIGVSPNTLISPTTPTISSGFGTSPSFPTQNGTASFTINVGTGGTASSGVVGLPTATNGWNCTAFDATNPTTGGGYYVKQTAGTSTTATLTGFNTAGAATAWTASDILSVSCFAR